MGVVTSASAHLEEVAAIKHYQRVKNHMVFWWCQHYEALRARGLGLTLISMGVINTGIWRKTKHLPVLLRPLVQLTIPGPEKYVQKILKDVACHRPASYPGVGANLFPVDGATSDSALFPRLGTAFIKTWFWLLGMEK